MCRFQTSPLFENLLRLYFTFDTLLKLVGKWLVRFVALVWLSRMKRIRVVTEDKFDWLRFLSSASLLSITEHSLPLELVEFSSKRVFLKFEESAALV